MKTVKTIGLAATAAVMMAATPSLAATVIFDDFSGAAYQAVDTPSGSFGNTATVAFGDGTRTLTADNATNNGISEAATSLAVAGGFLSFSNDDQATGTGTVTYTNVGDIALSANPFFFFDVGVFDAVANFSAFVRDTFGGESTFSELLAPGFDPKLFFSQFTGTADFNSVALLSFSISSEGLTDATDGSLDSISISAVPLPAGGLLLIAGLGGLASLRRKKRA